MGDIILHGMNEKMKKHLFDVEHTFVLTVMKIMQVKF
jgi:hypothetical protein